MPLWNGVVRGLNPAADRAETAEFVGAFLLRVAHHEQNGLSPSTAILAAAATVGVDPAAVLRATEEGTP
jgi:hypothetical protein